MEEVDPWAGTSTIDTEEVQEPYEASVLELAIEVRAIQDRVEPIARCSLTSLYNVVLRSGFLSPEQRGNFRNLFQWDGNCFLKIGKLNNSALNAQVMSYYGNKDEVHMYMYRLSMTARLEMAFSTRQVTILGRPSVREAAVQEERSSLEEEFYPSPV